jgi:predicted ArsR family transcriptional regulator
MPTKSTRQRILDILSNRDNASSAEISRALAVTQADVRYHLSRMVEEGLIMPSGPKSSGRRGRPARHFSLASKSMQDNFDLLSQALLTTSLEHFSEERKNIFLHQVAKQITAEFIPAGPLGRRLVRAVDQLNRLNYQARWEAHAIAPRMIFEHCPFATLRPQFPELCLIDANLLEILLDESITQVESSAHLSDGYCLFSIGQRKLLG